MAYTVYGQEVDDYIEKNYLDKINEVFIEEIGENLISIILFGGFGKGEGSLRIIEGRPVPYNDFDLYVVTKDKLSDEKLDDISMKASKAIGMGGLEIAYFPKEGYDSNKFFHVDVRCLPHDKLKSLMSMQRYYELKYGSQVIYGDKSVLDAMKKIDEEDIPRSDGLRNLFNKLHTMLLGLQETYNEDEKNMRIFWSYKCYLSICEALLILKNRFAPTATERARIFSEIYEEDFPEIFKNIPNLVKKVEKAKEFKLKLDFNVDPDKLWKEALSDIIEVFEFYVKEMTGNEDVAESISRRLPYTYFKPFLKEKIGFNFFPAQYVLNLGYANILREEDEAYFRPLFTWRDVGLRMVLPVYYLLKYKSSNEKEYLDKAYKELVKFIRVEEDKKGYFWHLKERTLKAYGLYYEQRLL